MRTLIGILIPFVCAGLVYLVLPLRLHGAGLLSPRPLNIMIVSACSLRHDRIIGDLGERLAPAIAKWAQGAFVFKNAVGELPWQNYSFDADEIFNRNYLEKQGYWWKGGPRGRYIIPQAWEDAAGTWFYNQYDMLNYADGVANLKRDFEAKKGNPFYVFAHLKYMHYPYIDSVNRGGSDVNYLSGESRKRLETYRANPTGFDERLPLISILFNDLDLLKRKFNIKNVHSTAGVVSDIEMNARWRQARGFLQDMRLLQEAYDVKMKTFDGMAAEILNLFGDEELQKRTIVIFTGDHGEAFMEHGVIGHAVNLYDEMLRYPLIVKIPGVTAEKPVEGQMTHMALARLISGLIEGKVKPENFAAAAEAAAPEAVLSRDCDDSIRSVRYRSEWKYIKHLASGEAELYNLKEDPKELRNVVASNREMAWTLEEIMRDRQSEFLRAYRRARNGKTCFPAR